MFKLLEDDDPVLITTKYGKKQIFFCNGSPKRAVILSCLKVDVFHNIVAREYSSANGFLEFIVFVKEQDDQLQMN